MCQEDRRQESIRHRGCYSLVTVCWCLECYRFVWDSRGFPCSESWNRCFSCWCTCACLGVFSISNNIFFMPRDWSIKLNDFIVICIFDEAVINLIEISKKHHGFEKQIQNLNNIVRQGSKFGNIFRIYKLLSFKNVLGFLKKYSTIKYKQIWINFPNFERVVFTF